MSAAREKAVLGKKRRARQTLPKSGFPSVKTKFATKTANRYERVDGQAVTYQREWVLCGKKGCRKKHGPYWYAYFWIGGGGRTRKLYIGRAWCSVADKPKWAPVAAAWKGEG